MTKTRTHSSADLSCAADFLDDIEVDESGKCEWAAVAKAQTQIRAVLRCWSAAEPQSSAETAIAALAKRFWSIHPSALDDMGLTREEFYASEMVKLFGTITRNEPQGVSQSSADSEAFRGALEQLAAVARTAVSYVYYANYSKREREAQSWIRKKHEELLASVLTRPQSNTGAAPRVSPQAAWQPVDTAPHEERVLLGWYQPDGTWFCETGMASRGWFSGSGISNMSWHGAATHWQPLPSPLSRPQSNTGEAS